MARILIVDDEADIRGLLSDILQDEGYRTVTASNAAAALQIVKEEQLNLVVLDIWLEGQEHDGIGVLKRIKTIHPNLPVIMISGHGNIETAVQTIKIGAYDFIEKPFKTEKLLIMVKRAMELSLLAQENKELKELNQVTHEIIGKSKAIEHIIDEVKLVAPTNSRILIVGEHGTGKEVLARMIHNLSNRKNKPFSTLHAANISEHNIEEVLFGIDDLKNFSVGLLEKSNGGTLFIDEISEMPLRVQAKFLKVIQENHFQKIGNSKQIPVDVRIITATSKDLLEQIELGSLNQSLYYRLNVVPLRLPPLRERKEDIMQLFDYFTEVFSKALGTTKITLSDEVMAIFEIYNWPGNIRQLKNVIEWLMIIHGKKSKIITTDLLPDYLLGKNRGENNALNLISNDISLKSLRDARTFFEKEYLKTQLERFSGNISKTAEFVGMERTALHRKLRALKIAD